MRALIAALLFTLAIAVTAAIFAIWPVVADAPWEDSTELVPTVDRTRELRCEGAYGLRDAIISAGPYIRESALRGVRGNPGGVRNYDEALEEAQREIDRYC